MDVLLIPGINNTRTTFDALCRAVSKRHSLQAVDCPPIDRVEAIADALLAGAPPSFIAVGHSFGGYVALAMLAACPQRVSGIVLINSNDWADTETIAAARIQKAAEAEAGDYVRLAEAASSRAYHPRNVERPDLMAERAASIEDYGAARYAAHQRASARRPDHRELLACSGKPVLIVTAEQDQVIPTERQTEMSERIGASQVIIPGSGHMLPVESPVELAEALTTWIDGAFPPEKAVAI